jgi:hypothetical protein
MRKTDLIVACLVLLLGAGCTSAKKKPSVAAAPPVAPLSGTELDQHNVEKVRTGEMLKAYPTCGVFRQSMVMSRKVNKRSVGPIVTPGLPTRVGLKNLQFIMDSSVFFMPLFLCPLGLKMSLFGPNLANHQSQ